VTRRAWFLFQVVGLVVLLISAPSAVHGLREGFSGPYEVHAAPPAVTSDDTEALTEDRTAAAPVDNDGSASTP